MALEDELLSPIEKPDDGYADYDDDLEDTLVELLPENPSYDFNDDDDYRRFDEDNQHCIDKTAGSKGNILHRLVNEGDTEKFAHLEAALTQITRHHPELLRNSQSTENKQTPLYAAVRDNKPKMVSALLKGFKLSGAPETLIHDVLQKQIEFKTCLHVAIRNNLDESAIHDLLSLASDDVLCIRDRSGRTPLHEAVRYHDCTTERLKTVRQMIQLTDKSLCLEDKHGRSAYVEHLKTREDYLDQQEKERKAAAAEEERQREQAKREAARNAPEAQAQPGSRTAAGKDLDPKSADKMRHGQGNKADVRGQESQRDCRKRNPDEGHADQKARPNQGAKRNMGEPGMGLTRRGTFQPGDLHRSESRVRDESRMRGDDRRRGEDEDRRRREDEDRRRKEEDDRRRREEDAKRRRKRDLSREKRQRDRDEKRRRGAERKRREKEEFEANRAPKILRENSEIIELELKLHCMRTRSPRETSNFIYGNNPEGKLICFDFPGPPTINIKGFEINFSHAKFDSVLQYVAFPAVKLEKVGRSKDSDDMFDPNQGFGRTDMVQFFKWLRNKKVTRIVKVIVDDTLDPPHSDKAIVDALKDLHVEELHWHKLDLDPVTIWDVSKDIREVYLRWSGNNTALRAWGEPSGLRRLKNLNTVYLDLVADKNLESYEQTKTNIKKFEARLNAESDDAADPVDLPQGSKRRIEVKERGAGYLRRQQAGNSSLTAMDMRANVQNHKWVDSIDDFAKHMRHLWGLTERVARKDSSKKHLVEPIVVALIDDGVDLWDPAFSGNLFEGKNLSFNTIGDDEPQTNQRVHPYYVSAAGHGTVMAHMIFRVCPMVKLYVLRMETHMTSDSTGNLRGRIVPGSAAAAINAAVDKGVNVISMSWTVTPDAESDDGKALQAAILRAAEANILMFASSSDGGQFRDDTWPTKVKPDSIFRIGAANADGSPFSWAGKAENLDYILPGVDVVKRKPPPSGSRCRDSLDKMATETGSSVATALAAGLAALLLSCYKMAAIEGSTVTEHVVREMQKHDHMKAALDAMKDQTNPSANKFLEVWDTMNTDQWPDYSNSDNSTKMKIAANQIRSMIPSKAFKS